MINDLESRLGGIAINAGHSAEAFKVQLILDAAHRFNDVRRGNLDRQFVELEFSRDRDILQRRRRRVIAQIFRNHLETSSGSVLRGAAGFRSRRMATGFNGASSDCAQSSTPFFQMKKKPARIRITKVSISRKPNIFSRLNTTAHG